MCALCCACAQGSLWPGEGWDDPGMMLVMRTGIMSLYPQDHGVCRPQMVLLQGRLFLLQSLVSKDLTSFNHEVLVHETAGILCTV